MLGLVQATSVKQVGIRVFSQFHSPDPLMVDAIKPDRLLVPTAKGTEQVELPGPNNVDHYKCYKTKVTQGAPKFGPVLGVVAEGQFTDGARVFDLRKPTRLCVPADKNGESIKDDTTHLMCYQAKAVTGQPKLEKISGIFVHKCKLTSLVASIPAMIVCIPIFVAAAINGGISNFPTPRPLACAET